MDPDQLASHKPANLDLHCFQTMHDGIPELSMVRVYGIPPGQVSQNHWDNQ